MNITKDTTIEELVEGLPVSIKYLMNQGIKCIACGEPIWGTLGEAATDKGFGPVDVERFVKELNKLAKKPKDDNNDAQSIDVDKLDL